MSLAERQDILNEEAGVWSGGMGSVGDYIDLLKPRVMSLVIFTAFVGMVARARHTSSGDLPVWRLLCIAIGAGASGAFNMWYDADIDAHHVAHRIAPDPGGQNHPR